MAGMRGGPVEETNIPGERAQWRGRVRDLRYTPRCDARMIELLLAKEVHTIANGRKNYQRRLPLK
jgi:hypothetical protein